MSEHPSRLALERYQLGELDLSEHLSSCARCQGTLKRIQQDNRAFLSKHPTPASLGAPPKARRPRAAAILAPLIALAATILLLILPQKPNTRSKGDTHIELLIKRSDQTFSFDQQRLRPGDTLLFRYSGAHTHMLVAGKEASGRVSIFVKDARLPPGQNRLAPQGVRLDDYLGKERIFLLLSDQPIDPEAVQERLQSTKLEDAPLLAPNAEQRSWLIEREAR